MICLWCQEPLIFIQGRGWVHQDGKVYKRYTEEDEVKTNDHRATPVREEVTPGRGREQKGSRRSSHGSNG